MSESNGASASGQEPEARTVDSPEARPSKRQRVEEPAQQAALSEYSLAYRIAQAEKGSPSSESLVGITSYVNPDLPPFEHAIIKHRFTDFLVWEIARGGRLVKLKNISRPDAAAITSTATENAASDTTPAEESKQEEATVPELKDFLSEEKVKELQAFFNKGKTPETEAESILTDVGGEILLAGRDNVTDG